MKKTLVAFLLLYLLYQPNVVLGTKSDPVTYTFLKLIEKVTNEVDPNGFENEALMSKLKSLDFDDKDSSIHGRSGQLDHQISGPRPEVKVKNGLVIGESIAGTHAFYSIPYGKAPTGSRRFMPPEPAEDFILLNASLPNYRMCWQIKDCDEDEPNCRDPMSEDCLVLNVNVPAGTVDLFDSTSPPSDRLPVLVWFHGGFFFRGRSTTTKYDGRWLSSAINAIVVSVNYRIGPLGFLSFNDELGEVVGNQGLKDQQMALRWVQENIEMFGGDKNKVTLFSNSAGGQAVQFHLLSPISESLFHRAITQSAPAVFRYQTPEESRISVTSKVLDYTGCSGNFSCLRTADAESITYSRNSVMAGLLLDGDLFGAIEPFRPVIDGNEFTDQPLSLFRDGSWQTHKEVIIGTNEDEMATISAFFEEISLPLPKVLFEALNNLVFGEVNGTTITSLYEERFDLDLSDNLADELTDLVFVCPNRALARYAAGTSTHPNKGVYLYNNANPLSVENCLLIEDLAPLCGNAYHSSEQIFVFKSAEGYETFFSSEDSYMSDMFSAFWGEFASTGDLSMTAGSPLGNFNSWPIYKSPSWENMRLEYPSGSTQVNYRGKYCDVWDEIGYKFN